MELTLSETKKIIILLNGYDGPNDFNQMAKRLGVPKGQLAQVVEFLQELGVNPAVAERTLMSRVDMEVPIDLSDELSYNYQVGKAILQELLEEPMPDKDELRKTLTTVQKFMDSMLKMQEKVYNVQQIQRFQEAVLEVLSEHELRSVIVGKLLELPL